MDTSQDLRRRGERYADSRGIGADFIDRVGFGEDGRVWRTYQNTVIKVFERAASYHTELACYQRLREEKLTSINGLVIPELVDFDDELRVIEITFVVPPWIIDFGKCYIDKLPPYDAREKNKETLKLRKRFGEDFPKLQAILWKLEQIGIYYIDARLSNVMFSPEMMEEGDVDDCDDHGDYEESELDDQDSE